MTEFKEIKSCINLKDIKSEYNKKGIFSFLHEEQKLNIIIYNKKFQKILLVNIGNYKRFNGKYKIAEKDGKGKEYIKYKKINI